MCRYNKMVNYQFLAGQLVVGGVTVTTIHATTESVVPFCSAQDDESGNMNYYVF